jgi:hypothetical protein
MTRQGHSQRGTKTRNDSRTRGGMMKTRMAEDNKDKNKEAQQQYHQQHQQPTTQHPDPGQPSTRPHTYEQLLIGWIIQNWFCAV